MTTVNPGPERRVPYPDSTLGTTDPVHEHPGQESDGGHRGHGLKMLVCCIPMIAIATLLVTTGAAGSGALLWALGCVVMMAVMMFAMPGGHNHE